MRTAIRALGAMGVLGALLMSGPAHAHGELQGTNPKDGATLGRAPGSVTITLTEAPTADAQLKVFDGCKRDVAADVGVDASDLAARIDGGEPGKWRAAYRAVSSEDGHFTKGSISFTVKGKRDCTPDKPAKNNDNNGDNGSGDGDGPTRAAGDEEGDEGGDIPVVPIALGTGGLLAIAIVVRMTAGRG